MTDERIYHEHVTNYMYKHPDQFTVAYKLINPEIEKQENIRLTVDTQSDFDLVKVIYKDLIDSKVEFNAEKIVKHIVSRPDWMETMKTEILANKK